MANSNDTQSGLFQGILTALITPFKQGGLDMPGFEKLLQLSYRQGACGVVVGGTTGESFALTPEEKRRLLGAAKQAFQDRTVMGCVHACYLEDAQKQADLIQHAGADGLLILPPFYVKADRTALYHFFSDLFSKASVPCILYNHPGRLGFELPLDLLQELAAHPRCVGIKEASSDLGRLRALKKIVPNFLILGGEDTLFPAALALGADGLISAGANVAPYLFCRVFDAWAHNDLISFKKNTADLLDLATVLAEKPNPVIAKHLAHTMTIGDGTLRFPLTPLSPKEAASYAENFKKHAFLSGAA